MKKVILLGITLALSVNAQAGRFETQSGRVIMEGDSVGKLIMYAGDPVRKRFDVVCTNQKRKYCAKWDNAEYWYYPGVKDKSVFWTITIMNEQIIEVKWSR